MIIRAYERKIQREELETISNLFVRNPPHQPSFMNNHSRRGRSYQDETISIEGTNGQIYTGFYRWYVPDGGKKSLAEIQGWKESCVQLGFRLSNRQSTKPLDEKVKQYGFQLKKGDEI